MVNKQTSNAALAAGAVEIRDAEAEKKLIQQAQAQARPIEDILDDHVEVLDGWLGFRISDKMPINESLALLDHAIGLEQHAGFLIGDVINHAEKHWHNAYQEAFTRTRDYSYTTLRAYAVVAERIPVEQRSDTLAYSHYKEIIRLRDPEKITKMIKYLDDRIEKKSEVPTTREIAAMVKKEIPKKERKPKATTKPPAKPGHKFTVKELDQIYGMYKAMTGTKALIAAPGFDKIIPSLPRKHPKNQFSLDQWEKWLSWFPKFYEAVKAGPANGIMPK